ncbi:hypothetical protein ORV05_28935 [Amycolatopsis cynarae]|uniref:Uncharacterized protein n=1 Tax=Amycolatopsis cynarae TaxID=2995223 RepID=A0ABY7B1Y6_9PSEU|nr:hypothetical protein [Amycolatopsis sp. HUAS 11-8]WAL64921.1 hypothetical protein ORV05_28935 [Amycolatopsis sp. HUAS 11-8]
MDDETTASRGTEGSPVLKILLRQRHLQSHRAFCREYDKLAERLDRSLKGGWPRKAQFYRWLSGDLVGLPYPDHCRILEAMFPGWTAEQLFQEATDDLDLTAPQGNGSKPTKTRDSTAPRPATSGNAPEIVATYPYRSHFTTAAWWDLISGATKRIDLLGYTLYFLCLEHPQFVDTLREKCANGCTVRAAIANPDSPHVAYRDQEEDQPITIVARVKTTMKHFTPLLGVEGFQVRYQDIPLYNSIFRFDDQMLVTPHLFATPGSTAPLLHLRKTEPQGLFTRFESHFDDVWNASKPADWTTPGEVTHGTN